MTTGKSQRPARASSPRRKTAAFRAAERARERRRRILRWVAVAAAVVIVGIGIGVGVVASRGSSGHPPAGAGSDFAPATLTGPAGPEGIVLEQAPLLAPASVAAGGQTEDGIECNSMEQAVYHIHTHLTIYVDGALRAVPAGVGVVQPVPQQTNNGVFDSASHCYYWLHTHAQDGIIHVEAPSHTTYTLGQFFAIWRQPLTTNQIGPAHGTVTAFVNGLTLVTRRRSP